MAPRTVQAAAGSTSARADEREALITEAKTALRTDALSAQELLALAKRLKGRTLFDFACRVLALARTKPTNSTQLRDTLAQQHALCTYKNPDAPLVDRLDEALGYLEEVIDLRGTTDQESLGIAGAIFKRKWQADGDKEHLETALEYYRRGFDQGPRKDYGYTGVNAACVLDLLSGIEIRQAVRTGGTASQAAVREAEAHAIRARIVEDLLSVRAENPSAFDGQWWWVVTLAEAYFGLKEFKEAGAWLDKARLIPDVPPWEFDSTAQQLAILARLQTKREEARYTTGHRRDPHFDPQGYKDSDAWRLLEKFLAVPSSVIQSAALGKVGLALSGGGFRASLFHIGVLAALAEHDLLRHVQVLSCVSGGSILGAYYYLELKNLLERTADQDVKPEHYVELIRAVEASFLAGVQQNVRMRVFGNLVDNWRMFFSRNYSRTHKIGELYEKHLYSRIKPEPPDGKRFVDGANGLRIRPAGVTDEFHPRLNNWRRQAKVPELVVNASTLNSGHQWQFTGSFMGEPPSVINTKVDGNYRLRRLHYDQAPDPHNHVRLGHAVGASSCVPGLFEPLQFRGLFPGVAVTLVDGGVHDNQGILSLLEQDCDHLIISDASGQMGEDDSPQVGPLSVLYRSDSVFQARMRDLAYRDLTSRIRGGVVTATYMHLKQGLDVTAKDWLHCDDPKEKPPSTAAAFTAYDVRKDVQRRLADIRTDLDSFSDAEAHALMTSGYKMTVHNLKEKGFDAARKPENWDFLYIQDAMTRGEPRLMQILEHSGSIAFKVWGLLKPLRVIGYAAMVIAFIAAAFVAWNTQHVPLLTVGGVLTTAIVFALTAALGPAIGRVLNAPGWWKRATFGVAVGLFGWAVTLVHLTWFDRWYLSYGRRTRF
jgi:predicted acylesterase/phospholipase RssA